MLCQLLPLYLLLFVQHQYQLYQYLKANVDMITSKRMVVSPFGRILDINANLVRFFSMLRLLAICCPYPFIRANYPMFMRTPDNLDLEISFDTSTQTVMVWFLGRYRTPLSPTLQTQHPGHSAKLSWKWHQMQEIIWEITGSLWADSPLQLSGSESKSSLAAFRSFATIPKRYYNSVVFFC